MRVCFVSFAAYPLFNPACKESFGGAEVQLSQLARALGDDTQFDVHFIFGDCGQPSRETIDGVQCSKFKQEPLLFRRVKGLRVVPILFRFTWHLLRINPNVIIQRSAGLYTGIIALFCILFRKRFIYMVAHEWDCSGEYEKSNRFFGKAFAFGLRHADTIIAQHREQQELLLKKYNRTSIVMRSAYRIPEEKKAKGSGILWVGRCTPWKQPEIFLQLAAHFPDEPFVMVLAGADDDALQRKVTARAGELRNVTLVHDVPFQQIGQYFQEAKVFVNTSVYEGFPNTFIQAAMHHTPILSLNVNPEALLNTYRFGLCAEGSVQALMGECGRLLSDTTMRHAMGERAYVYAKEHHDLRRIVEHLKQLLKNVIS